jgi:hypothetical protein
MPAEPKIPDWLGYIRPHIHHYDSLGRGERQHYIAKLSKRTQLSDNSLRRMIFAAQFLNEEGITELPPGGRLPVGAVERIARIAAREPEKRRQLLDDLVAGKLTIGQLKEQLKRSEKVAKRARKSRDDLPAIERAKAELAARGVATIEKMKEVDILTTGDAGYFERSTRPERAIMLPDCRRAVVLDGTAFLGMVGSFTLHRWSFVRNLLIGASLYDFVLVWAPFWQADVAKLLRAMPPEPRSRIIVMEVPADSDEETAASSD